LAEPSASCRSRSLLLDVRSNRLPEEHEHLGKLFVEIDSWLDRV
jgi:hypothetical protein